MMDKFEKWYNATYPDYRVDDGTKAWAGAKANLRLAWDAGALAQEIMDARSSCGLGDDN